MNSEILVDLDDHFTAGEPPPIERIRRRTYRGQACWAIGPERCVDCRHWRNPKGRGDWERSCLRYIEMMSEPGPKFIGDAFACKYFALRTNVAWPFTLFHRRAR